MKYYKTYILVCLLFLVHFDFFAQNTSTYQYDNNNRLSNSSNENTSFQYTFDELGNRVQYVIEAQTAQQTDLLVENISIPTNTINQGASLVVSCDVSNNGTTNSIGTYLKVYLANTSTGTDTELASKYVSEVTASGSVSLSFNITIPQVATEGSMYLVFYADATTVLTETNESNNKANVGLTIQAQTSPDLTIQNQQTNPVSLLAGESTALSADIMNTGNENAGSFYLKCYLSLNPTFESYNDIELTDAASNITTLNAGAIFPYNMTVGIPVNTLPGEYYVLFVADGENAISEQNKENNIAYAALTVNSQSSSGNLPVTGFSADNQIVGAGTTVQFADMSSNNPTSWQWSFPGGTPSFSTAQNPSVIYNSEGKFDVSLTSINSAGSNSISKSEFVYVDQVSEYDWLWQKPASGITDIAINNNSEIISIGGSSYAKYNSEGEIIWTKTIVDSKIRSVAVDKENNMYMIGTIRSSSPIDFGNGIIAGITYQDGENGFVAKFNNDGNCIWAHRIYNSDVAYNPLERGLSFMDICVDNIGNSYIVGYYEGLFNSNDFLYLNFPNGKRLQNQDQTYNLAIAKFSTDGITQWVLGANEYNGTGDIQGFSIDTDGENVAVVGHFSGIVTAYDGIRRYNMTANGIRDGYVLECSASTGYIDNFNQYGGSSTSTNTNYYDEAFDVKYGSSGIKYITGTFSGTSTFGHIQLSSTGDKRDAFLLKSNKSVIHWVKNVGSSISECIGTLLSVDENNSPYWLGAYGVNALLDGDLREDWGSFIGKYSETGELEFIKSVTTDYIYYPWLAGICIDFESNLYVGKDSKISKFGKEKPVIHPKLDCANNIICENSSTSISSPIGYVSYEWNSGESSSSITVTQQGDYYVKVTDINGNTGISDTISILSFSNPIAEITMNDSPIFCEGNQVELTANTGSDLFYKWLKDDNYISGATEEMYIADASGDYKVEISNSGNCSVLSDVMSIKAEPIYAYISIAATETEICEGTEVTFTAITTNEGETPVYQWKINGSNVGMNSNIFTSSALLNNDKITCTLTASGTCISNNSSVSNTILIILNQAPTASLSGDSTICEGEATDISIAFTGTAPWNITYTDGTTPVTITTSDNPYTFSVSEAETYQITNLSDANCTGFDFGASATVIVNSLPTSYIRGDKLICEGETTDISIELTGTAPWNITYTDGKTQTSILTSDNPYIFRVSEAGDYKVTYLSDANCTGFDFGTSATVIVNPLPTTNINGDKLICEGENTDISIALTGTAPWDITYTDGTTAVSLSTSDNPYTFSVSTSGVYEVLAISDVYCTGSDLGINATVIFESASIADFSYITENLTTSFINNSQNADTYLWDFGDGNLSINVNPVHTYITGNNYEVVLTAINNLCGSNEYSQTINITTSIFNLDDEGFIKLSPNPTNGIILLETENIKSNQVLIEIVNINGQTVYKELFVSQLLKEQIDLSEQPSGIYFIKIKADNFTKTMKLLKE